MDNWRSQLDLLYNGPLEFIFVVQSKSDPAYAALQQLLAEYCAAGVGLDRPIRLLVAGDAHRCSQKIHKCVLHQGVLCGVHNLQHPSPPYTRQQFFMWHACRSPNQRVCAAIG